MRHCSQCERKKKWPALSFDRHRSSYIPLDSHDDLTDRIKSLEADIQERNAAMTEVQSHLERLHGAGAEWDAQRNALQVIGGRAPAELPLGTDRVYILRQSGLEAAEASRSTLETRVQELEASEAALADLKAQHAVSHGVT
jgi:DNA repair exonuclease SbcCD ATPase subunit